MTRSAKMIVSRYAGAVAAVFMAWLVRWSLGQSLGYQAPYVTFVGAVLITTWLSGLGPGLAALALSVVVIVYAFIPPQSALHVVQARDVVGLALYVVVVAVCIGVTEALRAHHEARAAALRLSDERFRHLTEAVPSIVWTTAPDGTLTYVNGKWVEYTGLTPDEEARGQSELLLHPEDYERCMSQWKRSLPGGDRVRGRGPPPPARRPLPVVRHARRSVEEPGRQGDLLVRHHHRHPRAEGDAGPPPGGGPPQG